MKFDFLLPLLTYPDPSPMDGLLRAVDFAATLEGSLSALTQLIDIAPITNPLAAALIDVPAMVAAAEQTSRANGDRLVSHVAALARRHAVPVTTESIVCRAEETDTIFATAARSQDAALLAIDCASDTHREAAEALLFRSGGPVAMFPATEAATHLQTVVVAWDGGVSAARAVRDALPILRLAREVIVLTAHEDKPIDTRGIAAIVEHLARHGIAARHEDVALGGLPVGDVLQSEALRREAGLLVMGAYGHSRLRQFVLGGATRSTLANLRLPILMSH